MDNRGELLTKIKGLFGGKGSENKPEVSDEAEKQQVLEKFRLMGAVGPERQNPVASYGEGSTLMLTDLPIGTILREECTSYGNPSETYYIFWYVGGIDDTTGKFKLFDHTCSRLNHALPYIVNLPNPGCFKREFEINNGKLEFEVGQPGIMLDLSLRSRPSNLYSEMYKSRRSIAVDVMEFGKRVKQDVKETQRQPLRKLVPTPVSKSI